MEEKKCTKISVSTFLLIITIIALGVMGFFIYKISNDKSAEEKKSAELQSQVNSLNGTVSQLQDKIDAISNSITSNTQVSQNTNNDISTTNKTTESTKNNANNETFTEAQVKQAASDYLELYANANCGIPLDTLKVKGKIDYDSSKSTVNTNNGEVTTNVKFADYKKAMLNYVTESEFERNWTSQIHLKEDSNGYLTHGQCGGALTVYTVNSVSKIDDNTFIAQTISMLEHDATTKTNEKFTFTVKSYNGNCVIDSVK